MIEKIYLVSALLIWFAVGYIIWKIVRYAQIKKERKQSVKKSRSVILWETFETIAPFMKNIPYHSKDMNFIWKWVDYIVFDKLSAWKLKEIVFLEIKTWKSQLNSNERQIRNIIESWKVRYEVKTLK